MPLRLPHFLVPSPSKIAILRPVAAGRLGNVGSVGSGRTGRSSQDSDEYARGTIYELAPLDTSRNFSLDQHLTTDYMPQRGSREAIIVEESLSESADELSEESSSVPCCVANEASSEKIELEEDGV
ncbi:hypothetical protein OUZ56_026341 [Daphnia magna]|uniref:Uncharacterized protein n=1 Tax=Daphnia magna TaxID=35525 RepID=A0ABQ9ZLL8_9CRUS|nr:hypothetical protein OUZ56_026341 [Daphnia magna]